MNIKLLRMIGNMAVVVVVAGVALIGIARNGDAAGLLTPADGSRPALEIQDHVVKVVIEDGYAITTVEQVFRNPHPSDLEAIYSFPVPENAAVAEFTYWIDGKPVSGEVVTKEKARRIYEDEKAAGREAAVTEQDDYRTFDISVWPVRAGKDVRIRIAYMQPAHIDTGVGRYVYPLEEGGVDEQKLAFWTANEEVKGRFSFDLVLRSAYPVEALRLPSHPHAVPTRNAAGDWLLHIDNSGPLSPTTRSAVTAEDEGTGPARAAGDQNAPVASNAQAAATRLDRDIVVYWRLRSGLPGSIDLVAHKEGPGKRGTFMMVVTPGDDLQSITAGRDWVFVLDKSGSMARKFQTLAEGVARGLKTLRPEDRFRIVWFNNQAHEFESGFLSATTENVARAITALRQTQVNGGTNLYAGLARGLKGLDMDRSSGVVLITDGVANVGETNERAFLRLVEKQDVRLFTLVMGNSANRPLLKAISQASGGTAISVSNSDDIIGAVLSATSKLSHEALHDVRVEIDGVRTNDITPKRFGGLYRGQQLVLFGHYWGSGQATVTVSAKISGKPVIYRTRFAFPDIQVRNPEVERLWAFAAIEDMRREMQMFGEDADIKQGVIDTAIENGLVTPYTSMIVVGEEVFAQHGIGRGNRQRLVREATARQTRAQTPVRSARVDQTTPTFKTARASYKGQRGSGGGAVDPAAILLMLLAGTAFAWRSRRGHECRQ